ncbi:hypothetical protein LX15_001477 [Streptoalloteichus tenebrarius]|uniref:Uncharacterized protein n=1 Tax=Streptoalloteichus tenebrarius (strain ATCC 17920 / DSM 40477 / JCM 4838 / CBS 697.72 / NBRC 16177 / NCIMB 11028 / NRRL B-12390 / A12253. 1 / ISP 5477) TaxID=1933 RepID=A0ABT1HQJ7_STRSD|nr:hypothetical protein [Streptoalloteichus tenebrarius]
MDQHRLSRCSPAEVAGAAAQEPAVHASGRLRAATLTGPEKPVLPRPDRPPGARGAAAIPTRPVELVLNETRPAASGPICCGSRRPRGRCCARSTVPAGFGLPIASLTGPQIRCCPAMSLVAEPPGSRSTPVLRGGPHGHGCCSGPSARFAVLAGRGHRGCPRPTVLAGPGLPVAILTGRAGRRCCDRRAARVSAGVAVLTDVEEPVLHETMVRRIGADLLRFSLAEGTGAARGRQSLPALGSRLRSSLAGPQHSRRSTRS